MIRNACKYFFYYRFRYTKLRSVYSFSFLFIYFVSKNIYYINNFLFLFQKWCLVLMLNLFFSFLLIFKVLQYFSSIKNIKKNEKKDINIFERILSKIVLLLRKKKTIFIFNNVETKHVNQIIKLRE
jgi:hypothetical protein